MQAHRGQWEGGWSIAFALPYRNISSNMALNSSKGSRAGSPFLQSACSEKLGEACVVYSEEPLAGVQRRKSKLFMKPRLTKDSKASYILCVSLPHL